MQDRVAAHVSAAISPALHTYEVRRSERKPTENLTAYDFFLRALPANQKSLSQNEEALRYLYKAIDLDPSYGAAYGLGAWCYTQQKLFGWLAPTDVRLKEGIRFANMAAEAGKNDSEALWMAGYALTLIAGEFDRSLVVADKSISLNANSANAWWISGTARIYLGDTKNALHDLGRAQRLDPLSPLAEAQWMSIAIAHFFAEQYEEAAEAADKSLGHLTTYPPALRLKIVTCGLLGRIDEGRTYVQRLLTLNPDSTVAKLKAYYDPLLRHNPRGLEYYLKGLRLCGLPEGNSQ
jgi:tetratricopeptide (TPR) repeat protein